MDFEVLKDKIGEIVSIAEGVPERYREGLFGILAARLIADSETLSSPLPERPVLSQGGRLPSEDGEGKVPVRGQVLVFMRKTGLTAEQLNSVVSYVDGEVHFLREPQPSTVAKGQMQWALLYALKTAIEQNSFLVDAEAFAGFVTAKGFHTGNNYYAVFGRNSSGFVRPPSREQPRQNLNGEGLEQLAELVRSLAS